MDSAGICWNLPESAGICWTPLGSAGIRWTPLDSTGIRWTPPESAGLCWTGPLDFVWSDSADSGGLPLDRTCEFGPCHTHKVWDLGPPESDRSCGGVYSPCS